MTARSWWLRAGREWSGVGVLDAVGVNPNPTLPHTCSIAFEIESLCFQLYKAKMWIMGIPISSVIKIKFLILVLAYCKCLRYNTNYFAYSRKTLEQTISCCVDSLCVLPRIGFKDLLKTLGPEMNVLVDSGVKQPFAPHSESCHIRVKQSWSQFGQLSTDRQVLILNVGQLCLEQE